MIDEKSPESGEAPGYWIGVSHHVGDHMTYHIYAHRSGKILQRSAIRSADPNKGGVVNNRINFSDDEEDEEPLIIDPHIDDPQSSIVIPRPITKRTNKHKVKGHDTKEASFDQANDTEGYHESVEGEATDFKPRITPDELD